MQAFMGVAGMRGGPPPSSGAQDPEAAERAARMGRNLVRFFEHGLMPISGYAPDIAALTAGPPVVVAVGETSAGQLAHETALALAQRLDVDPMMFPGDHGGFAAQPAQFAWVLRQALSE
jgi:hypothetical protein